MRRKPASTRLHPDQRLSLPALAQWRGGLARSGGAVSRLWNAADYVCRQAHIAGKPVPGYAKLCSLVPKLYPADYAALPSDIAQETLKKLTEAWKSFFALCKRYAAGKLKHRPGLPRYRKFRDGTRPCDYIPVKSSRSCVIGTDSLSLTLPADLRKDAGRLKLSIRGEKRYCGRTGRIELAFDAADRRWRVTVSVEVPERELKATGRAAGIDLGLRVTAALAIEGQRSATLFSGREMLKEFKYWTRQIARHQAALAKRKLKTSRQLKQLYQTRRRRMEHALRAIAKAIGGVCRTSGVKQVAIGWPKGIREDVKTCKDWRGRMHNYWAFNRMGIILKQALEKQRIVGTLVGERGTSSTCPWTVNKDHKLSRKPRHRLTCVDCGTSMHSDAAGALNMMQLKIPGFDRDTVKATARPRVYEWQSHSWTLRPNRGAQALRLAA